MLPWPELSSFPTQRLHVTSPTLALFNSWKWLF